MFDLQKKREAKKLTQEQLAQKVGISRQAISLIEVGINAPSVETAKKIAEVLEFNWTDFYEKSSC